MNDHEENVRREFEEKEGITETKVKDLGTVEPHRTARVQQLEAA